MELPFWLEKQLMQVCDLIFAVIPQQAPTFEKLDNCKIISHRGQHDNRDVYENTLTAFDCALETDGIWGIELDFRWTKDLYPVVYHDPDLERLFGSKTRISEITLTELKQRFPLIPTLEEVLNSYGGKLHLMVEAKEEHYPQPEKQNSILNDLFSHLQPIKDFHLISLVPEMLELANFVDRSAKILVAVFNEKLLSNISLDKNYAGLGGHYLLLHKKLVEQHLACGQKIGVGYPKSKNNLFREINRGVEWIFCNDAVKLSSILNAELQKAHSIMEK
ncbi:MAG: glycerophosphodiester phosphodiesterase [SAR324 cluster bacterium]|nr:glycerophosphodiester phosphodiesterase [SAR324 cluster bacterium]MBL7034904.1 glycerophosphodiester phosphodiesterase [SAR324 cluster bacterium]